MTDYYYQTEDEDVPAEAPAVEPRRRSRFDPTRDRGSQYFDRAHRHSRRVRWLKIALPVVAALGVIGFFAIMQFTPKDGASVITLAGVNVDSKSLVMEKPHISGFRETRQSYEIRAIQAIQDLANPKVVTLKTIQAKFGVGDGVSVVVDAVSGVFDSTVKTVHLSEGIKLRTSNGYRATLVDAQIDIDKGTLNSSKPVEIVSAQGTIKADSIEILDRGARVWFRGGVKVNFAPKDEPEKSEPAAPAGAASGGKPAADAELRAGGSS